MLKEDEAQLVDVMFEVGQLAEGDGWVEDDPSGDAARYCAVLSALLNHEYDEKVLSGFKSDAYGPAVTKLLSILEDSGWKLAIQGRPDQGLPDGEPRLLHRYPAHRKPRH